MVGMTFQKRASVAIAGAGLAGLCLAQRLLAEGIDVQLYEADEGPFVRRQGYRITVDKHGQQALRQSLPAPLADLAFATAGAPGGYFRFTNQNLRDAVKLRFKPTPGAARQMDRQVLRSVLLVGLADRVHYGKAAVGLDTNGSDNLLLRFADGTAVTAPVVVGADGIGSALRPRVLPGNEPEPVGLGGIYGRTALVRDGAEVIPQVLAKSGVLAIGDQPGRAFFFTTMRYPEPPPTAFARLAPGHAVVPATDYVMWGITLTEAESREAGAPDAAALREYAGWLAKRFHPLVRSLINSADEDATVLAAFSAARRPREWALPRATLVGDAVHAMPPFGAHGGNTALRDAALLGGKLIAAARANAPVEPAITCYQDEMVPYAFKAVDSATAMTRRLTAAGRLQRWLLLAGLPRLHRVTVADSS
jgi:2-polyprenyl-6-methoxyphenol hydroxylase-like FAD-dependent oxidoreductase